jgi:hypothetical protein
VGARSIHRSPALTDDFLCLGRADDAPPPESTAMLVKQNESF